MEMKKERSEVPALEATIKILEYLSRYHNRESSLADISKGADINKSTCHRILKVLEHHNYVFYNEDKKQYSLGSYLVVLGARATEFIDYLDICKPHLVELSKETQQTVVLLEPIANDKLMYVAKEEPSLPVRVTVSIGQRFPLTSASFGKCYLAFMDESKADEIIRKSGFKPFTSKTITNVEEFKQELKNVKKKGYAESYEEHTPGVCGVAAPIFNLNGEVKLVLSCVYLSNEPDADASFYGEKVLEVSRAITKVLGGRPPIGVS
ncbi:IclR family transcriptional regulator [Bacillus sp. FJAT-27251]|uniref:IclR family transcriptional regulator n=1 Tax=Bacillus sp. FJAT-27251 TaxID=1684142 RepID=UPI0006A78A6C|nr:IclR family transcriptional regulator [Bacillus sp. FJAT-27251]